MMILTYAPAYLVPLITSLAGIYAITRILSPAEYGLYALALSLMALCQSALFSWLDLGAKRFYERANVEGRIPALAASLYLGLAISAGMLGVFCVALLSLARLERGLASLLAIGAAVTAARELSLLGKTFQLTALARTRYTLMECGESIVGLAVGLALCWYTRLSVAGLLWGMLAGAAVVVAFDAPYLVRRLRGGLLDLRLQREIAAFAAPISIAFFTEYVVASGDRLLIQWFLGAAPLGIYAVGYSMAERAVSAVFLALSVASYPLVMRAFQRDGAEAARGQARDNAELLMTFAIPAWAGFTVASGHLAKTFLGPEFAPQAAVLMPPIAAAVFLNCLRAHYFAQSSHLARRTWTVLGASVPAAGVKLGLNCVLLQRLGLSGAAWASVAAYAFALGISMWQAKFLFPLPFPWRETAKALLASFVMCVVLRALAFPETWRGLAALVLTGAAIYAALIAGFDIGRLRSRTAEMIESRRLASLRTLG